MLTDDEVQAAIDAGNAECRRRHTGIRGQMMMPGYDPYVCVARAVEAAVYEKSARECEGAAEMTEADIVQRLREMQADMNDAIEKMDASAFDTGMMRQIRAEQHDFYKEAADEIERLRAEVEALRRTATDRAGIIDSVREWARGVVDDNWALRAEVEALRAVLRLFLRAGCGNSTDFRLQYDATAAARAALAQAKDAEARG